MAPQRSINGHPLVAPGIISPFFLFLFFIAFFALCPGSREGGVAFDDDAVSLDIGGLVVRGELAVYDVVLLLRWRAPYDG